MVYHYSHSKLVPVPKHHIMKIYGSRA